MESISDMTVEQMPPDSPYVRPFRLNYLQAGRKKFWDMVQCHESVYVVVYNVEVKKMVFVRQFRPTAYYARARADATSAQDRKQSFNTKCQPLAAGTPIESIFADKAHVTDPGRGLTLELCAGIVDKADKSLADIALEEVEEECGYRLPSADRLVQIQTCIGSVGLSGQPATLFYVEVDESMRVTREGEYTGSHLEGEMIQVVELSVQEVNDQLLRKASVDSTPYTLCGIMWFMMNRASNYV